MECKEAIVGYAKNCDLKPDWWTSEGGKPTAPATGNHIFDAHSSTYPLVSDRYASRFAADPITKPPGLSPLEIALATHIREVIKHLSSCLYDVGVADHPMGGSADVQTHSARAQPRPLRPWPPRWPGGDVSFLPGGNVAAPAHPHPALSALRWGADLPYRTRTSSAQIPASSPCWLSTPDRVVEANGRSRS
jgi:hypothetical protein